MKRIAAVFVLLILIAAAIPVYADGISVISDAGDKISIFEDIRIDSKTNGDVVVIFGDADVMGPVSGDVVVILGDVTVDAAVSGTVISVLGNTKLKDSADIGGDVVSIGALEKSGLSRIHGQEVNIAGGNFDFDIVAFMLARVISTLVFAFFVLVIGLFMIALSKEKLRNISAYIECRTGRKIAMGFLGLLGAVIIVLILFITVIAPLLYFILLAIAGVYSSIYFGKVILRAFSQLNNIYVEFFTGLITVTLLKIVLIYLVPQEDILFSAMLYIVFTAFINSLGLGIMLDSKYSGKPGTQF